MDHSAELAVVERKNTTTKAGQGREFLVLLVDVAVAEVVVDVVAVDEFVVSDMAQVVRRQCMVAEHFLWNWKQSNAEIRPGDVLLTQLRSRAQIHAPAHAELWLLITVNIEAIYLQEI